MCGVHTTGVVFTLSNTSISINSNTYLPGHFPTNFPTLRLRDWVGVHNRTQLISDRVGLIAPIHPSAEQVYACCLQHPALCRCLGMVGEGGIGKMYGAAYHMATHHDRPTTHLRKCLPQTRVGGALLLGGLSLLQLGALSGPLRHAAQAHPKDICLLSPVYIVVNFHAAYCFP